MPAATSIAGRLAWEVDHSTPVIAPGTLHPPHDQGRAGACHVLRVDGRYRMLYWGTDAAGLHRILAAESAPGDPGVWRPRGAPLIGPQPASAYNCLGPSFPFLLPVDERRWLLYFCAWGRSADGKLPNTTGLAISDDAGLSWRCQDGPVIPRDRAYDAEGTGSVWVLRDQGRLRMYYTAIGRYLARPAGARTHHGETIPSIGIAYAESDDGLAWRKPIDRLLVAPRGFDVEPFEYICSKPCVLREPNGGYVMWVNTFGTAYRVHRLESDDGIAWRWCERRGPDGELGVGAPGAFDDHQRSYPSILREGATLHCWYTGNGFGRSGIGYARARLVQDR